MSTITKERLQRLICAIDSENYDEEEIVDWVNSDEIMELARIALASLEAEPVPGLFIKCTNIEPRPGEVTIAQATPMADGKYHESCFQLYAAPPAPIEAEPVAYMWDSDRKDVDAAGYYRPEHKIFAESSVKRYGGKVVALYAAPPAPVANIHPLLEFAREYIESWDLGMVGDSSLLASAKKAIADSSAHQPAPVSVPDERAAFNAWNNDTDCPLAGRDAKTAAWLAWCRRAAMLQGADVSLTNEGNITDNAEMITDKIADDGNSPFVSDGWVLVPVEPTAEMQSAAASAIRFDTTPINKLWTGNAVYKAMLSAAPQQEVK